MLDDLSLKLLAAALGAAATPLFQYVLYPWFIEYFREPTKLRPSYTGELRWEDVGANKITVKLRKHGYRVSGTLLFMDGKHKGKEYELSGRYSHGLLTFTYLPADSGSTSQGSGTFQRLKDGELFKGYFAYVSLSSGKIETMTCELNAV